MDDGGFYSNKCTWGEDKKAAFYAVYDVEKGVYKVLKGTRRPWPPLSERQGLRIIIVVD